MELFSATNAAFPPLNEARLGSEATKFLASLPKDYREFLLVRNGGSAPEFRYTFLTGVPFKTKEVDNPSRDDCVVEFFGLRTTDDRGDWPKDLLEVAAQYEAEGFLPSGVLAIARCIQSSLVCISVREDDYGAIYYWDWYWQYPWCKHFFEARIQRAADAFTNVKSILDDVEHPQHQDVHDALNYASLVKLADSFPQWHSRCKDAQETEGGS